MSAITGVASAMGAKVLTPERMEQMLALKEGRLAKEAVEPWMVTCAAQLHVDVIRRFLKKGLYVEAPSASPVDWGEGFIEGRHSGAKVEHALWAEEMRAFLKRMDAHGEGKPDGTVLR